MRDRGWLRATGWHAIKTNENSVCLRGSRYAHARCQGRRAGLHHGTSRARQADPQDGVPQGCKGLLIRPPRLCSPGVDPAPAVCVKSRRGAPAVFELVEISRVPDGFFSKTARSFAPRGRNCSGQESAGGVKAPPQKWMRLEARKTKAPCRPAPDGSPKKTPAAMCSGMVPPVPRGVCHAG